MNLPNKIIDEYENYNRTRFNGNRELYRNLSHQQIEVIRNYSRWYTKNKFYALAKNTSLTVKPKKAEVLSNIMGGFTDWVYDGCIDTGELGGGHCALGHALRYEHYAYSPSSNREIIFGVSCASDFFGIEPEKLHQISKIQEDLLNQIKFIIFIKETGKYKWYFESLYGDLPEFVGVMRNQLEQVFDNGYKAQMDAFINVGLPWTSALVSKYNKVKNKQYKQKVAAISKLDYIKSRYGTKEELVKYIDSLKDSKLAIDIAIINYIVSFKNKETSEQDNKNNVLLKLGALFSEACKINESKLFKVAKDNTGGTKFLYEVLAEKSKTTVLYTDINGNLRLATKGEIESNVSKLKPVDKYAVGEFQYKHANAIAWFICGNTMYYKNTGNGYAETLNERVEKSAFCLRDAAKWMICNQWESDYTTIINSNNTVIYPDTAEDEIKETPLKDIINFFNRLDTRTLKKPYSKYIDIAMEICENHFRYRKDLTEKQVKLVRITYDNMNNTKEDKDDILNKAAKLLEFKNSLIEQLYSFSIKVAKSVIENGRCSEKQRVYIEEAYDALMRCNETEDNEVEKLTVDKVKEIEKINIDEPDEIFKHPIDRESLDGEDIEKYTINKEETDEEAQIYYSNEDYNFTYTDNFIKDNRENVNLGIPRLSEISNALGNGTFKE